MVPVGWSDVIEVVERDAQVAVNEDLAHWKLPVREGQLLQLS